MKNLQKNKGKVGKVKMRNTLELMKEIINGKEENIDEINLIKEYQEKLSPNILAYFYCNNFGIISKTALNYPIISNEDKASFCLQELDKALKRYQLNSNAKFITYFIRCFKNRLRMETEQLLTQKIFYLFSLLLLSSFKFSIGSNFFSNNFNL